MRIPPQLFMGMAIALILVVLYLSLTAAGLIPRVFDFGYSNTGEYLLTLRGLLGASLLLFLLFVFLWSRFGKKRDEEL